MNYRDEDRAEAERLKHLPRADQRRVVALVQAVAADPRVPAADRREARTRAAALEALLRIRPTSR